MISVLTSLLIFILTLVIHLFFRRRSGPHIRLPMYIYADFAVGFAVNVGVVLSVPFTDPLPLTSLALYVLLSLSYIIFAASPVLGQESPSSVIVLLARQKGKITAGDIKKELSAEALIGNRFSDLVRSGWVKQTGNTLSLTQSGHFMSWWVRVYRNFLGIKKG